MTRVVKDRSYHGPWKLDHDLLPSHHCVLESRKDMAAVQLFKTYLKDHCDDIDAETRFNHWTPLMMAACYSRDPGPRACLAAMLQYPVSLEAASRAFKCAMDYYDDTSDHHALILLMPYIELSGQLEYATLKGYPLTILKLLVTYGARYPQWSLVFHHAYVEGDLEWVRFIFSEYPEPPSLNEFSVSWIQIMLVSPSDQSPWSKLMIKTKLTILNTYVHHGLSLSGVSLPLTPLLPLIRKTYEYTMIQPLTQLGLIPEYDTVMDALRSKQIDLSKKQWLQWIDDLIHHHALPIDSAFIELLIEYHHFSYANSLLHEFAHLSQPSSFNAIILKAIQQGELTWALLWIEEYPDYVSTQRHMFELYIPFSFRAKSSYDHDHLIDFLTHLATAYHWEPGLEFMHHLKIYAHQVPLNTRYLTFIADHMLPLFVKYPNQLIDFILHMTNKTEFPLHRFDLDFLHQHGSKIILKLAEYDIFYPSLIDRVPVLSSVDPMTSTSDSSPDSDSDSEGDGGEFSLSLLRDALMESFPKSEYTKHMSLIYHLPMPNQHRWNTNERYWKGYKKATYQHVLSIIPTAVESWMYQPNHWRMVISSYHVKMMQGQSIDTLYANLIQEYPWYIHLYEIWNPTHLAAWLCDP